ncbi:MAG: type IX secretion system protein PorQ [Bacteroidales bacterium]|nr:MAG: type IX secretion system protein PorQ [Bacteroidales bacterium]
MRIKGISAQFILLLVVCQSFAQVGGEGAYQFLNLTTTPRLAALGGKVATLGDPELGLALYNPSLLNLQMHNQIALSYVGYYAGVKYGSALYSRNIGKFGTIGIGIMEVSYGTFTEANEGGAITGSFTASDMAINLIYSRAIDSIFTVGINLKPLYSHLYTYNSFGIAADIGVNYHRPNSLFSAGLVLRNIGTMIKPYTPHTYERLPFEAILGISKKLAHAPFRFVVTLHQLQNLNMYYKSPQPMNSTLGTEDNPKESKLKGISSEALSHLILGVEFTPLKSFTFRLGYNYQRRNELKVEEKLSSVGFSWGFGVRISKFQLSYGQSRYHLVGPSKYFSICTDLDDLFGRDKL